MEPHHVFTVIAGFGLRVIPRPPFLARHGPGQDELDVEVSGPAGPLGARILADHRGGYRSKLPPGTEALGEVLEVEPGPSSEHWLLETERFRARFPPGFTLHSVPRDSPTPFDLVGPGGCLLYLQLPETLPDWGQPEGRMERTYQHQGATWWQRYQVVEREGLLAVVTAQAPEGHRQEALVGLGVLCESLVVLQGPPGTL